MSRLRLPAVTRVLTAQREIDQLAVTQEHFVLSPASTVFFSISMTGDIFIFR